MTEDERLYLQFLQSNIARMNTNSAQAKGWCIAIVAALLAIFAETKNILFIWICLVPHCPVLHFRRALFVARA